MERIKVTPAERQNYLSFIDSVMAFNNTLKVALREGMFFDSAKNLDGFTANGFKLVQVYQATEAEHIAAMSGEGQMSTFAIGGHTFIGNVYTIERA